MISNQWIEKRRPYWDRLTVLAAQCQQGGVRKLGREELRELALLYRHVANDLSAKQPHIVDVVLDGSFRQAGLDEMKEERHEV